MWLIKTHQNECGTLNGWCENHKLSVRKWSNMKHFRASVLAPDCIWIIECDRGPNLLISSVRQRVPVIETITAVGKLDRFVWMTMWKFGYRSYWWSGENGRKQFDLPLFVNLMIVCWTWWWSCFAALTTLPRSQVSCINSLKTFAWKRLSSKYSTDFTDRNVSMGLTILFRHFNPIGIEFPRSSPSIYTMS